MKAWKSGVWSLSGQAIQLSVMLGSLAILGRLLTPEEFGLFGIVMAVQALFLPVLDMGMRPAYIKMDKVGEDASHAFFTVNVIVGGIACLSLLILAPWLALFYEQTSLQGLFTIFAFALFLTAINGQPAAVLNRNKRYDKIVLANLIVVFLGAGLVISLAWFGLGVWSLIWRALFEAAARFIFLVVLSGQHYRIIGFRKIKPYFKDLGFGLEIVFSRLLNSWLKSIDKLVLGKFISLGELGAYTRSQQVSLIPNTRILPSITNPALAYLARIRQQDKLGNYLLLNWLVFLSAGMPCLLLVVYGDILLPLFLGPQWFDVAWMLQWFGLLGLGRVFQGMSVTYHIDQRKVKRSMCYTIGTIPFVLATPIVIIVVTESLRYFVSTLAVMSFVYWFTVLLWTMLRDWHHESLIIIKMYIKMLCIVLISIIAGLYVKQTWLPEGETVILLLTMVVQFGGGLLLFIALDHDALKRIHRMVRGWYESDRELFAKAFFYFI